MASHVVDPKTGAVTIVLSPEEQELKTLIKKNRELEKRVEKLEKFIEEFIK